MARVELTTPVKKELRGASVALGNFDGVHEGHRAVVTAAHGLGPLVAALVFEPHPRRYFQPDAPPFRIQSARQRAAALRDAGADVVLELRFDGDLAGMSDEAFVAEVLVRRLNVSHVAVGSDFRFGRDRIGDASALRRFGSLHGFGVTVVDVVDDESADGAKVSSSAIRTALGDGRIEDATRMLGRPWAVEGEVKPGFKRGRTIGYPTANVALGEYCRPRNGVYATRTNIGDGEWRAGASSCGVNPTVGMLSEPLLETYIFGFDDDIYGRRIETQFVHFLREERHFDSLEALKTQIEADCDAARALLA